MNAVELLITHALMHKLLDLSPDLFGYIFYVYSVIFASPDLYSISATLRLSSLSSALILIMSTLPFWSYVVWLTFPCTWLSFGRVTVVAYENKIYFVKMENILFDVLD